VKPEPPRRAWLDRGAVRELMLPDGGNAKERSMEKLGKSANFRSFHDSDQKPGPVRRKLDGTEDSG
jgi:hypothetical protein